MCVSVGHNCLFGHNTSIDGKKKTERKRNGDGEGEGEQEREKKRQLFQIYLLRLRYIEATDAINPLLWRSFTSIVWNK